MMQPKLKSKVLCTDREVGEVTKVIVDPLSQEVSHIVVGGDGMGPVERQVPMGQVSDVSGDVVTLRSTSADFTALPVFNRQDYVTTHEVEIAHLEERRGRRSGGCSERFARARTGRRRLLRIAGRRFLLRGRRSARSLSGRLSLFFRTRCARGQQHRREERRRRHEITRQDVFGELRQRRLRHPFR